MRFIAIIVVVAIIAVVVLAAILLNNFKESKLKQVRALQAERDLLRSQLSVAKETLSTEAQLQNVAAQVALADIEKLRYDYDRQLEKVA